MKTISIANLKGGVHKTTTAVSMAELMANRYQKKVLLLDNDKQGDVYKRQIPLSVRNFFIKSPVFGIVIPPAY